MELTWVAIGASLLMGVGAVLIFVFSVKQDYFKDLEDAKYQVFWSDLEDLVENANKTPSPSQNNSEVLSSNTNIKKMESNNGNKETCE
jgi:nitrogen fixation-related uncharacterized protein